MTLGKTNGRRTSGQAVMNALKKAGALDEKSAVGYEVLQKVRLTTPVLAYTIANLMEENVVVQTEDERYYFNQAGWNKLEWKVLSSYAFLFIIPAVAYLLFMLISKLMK